VDEIKFVSPF
jgi:hypothetical protein